MAFIPNLTVILYFGEAALAPKKNVQSKDVSAASSNKGFRNPAYGLLSFPVSIHFSVKG